MPDIFDQVAEQLSAPHSGGSKGDIFDQVAESGLSAGIAGLRARSNPEEWRDRANNEIRRIETGVDLTKTDAGDGTFSYQEQQVHPPRPLSNSEKIAILDAHRQQYSVFDQQTPETGQRMATQEEAYRQDQLRRQYENQGFVRNAANAGLNAALSLGPNVAKVINPSIGSGVSGLTLAQGQEAVSDVLAADPESWGTTTGSVVGGATPFMLGPAGLVAGAASGAGQFREQVQQARQQGTDVPVMVELVGAGLIAANTLAMGRFRPAGANVTLGSLANNTAFKSEVVNAIGKYSLEMGLGMSDMTILQAGDDVIKKLTLNPEQSLTEGSGEAGAVGVIAAAVTHAPGLARGIRGAKSRVQPVAPTAEAPAEKAARGKQEQQPPTTEFRPDETLTSLKQQLREERIARRTDPLTKAPNEVQYHEDATRIFADADTRNESIALVETDVGGLKVMNTVYGHAGGDEMLGKVHELMADELRMPPQKDRPEDYLGSAAYRIGGDEFPAILRGIKDRAGVKAAMDRVNGKFDSWLAAQYPDLPAAARPFIAWDTVIRKPGDTTAIAELRKQADAGVEAEKSAIKAQRNVPEGRTELLEYIEKHKQPPTGEAAQPPEMAKAISPIETQSQATNEPIRKNVGNLADVTVAADQGKPSLEQRAKPAIPGEARDWSYTKLKGWAKANGYDISKADNIRSLRLRVAEQRGDSLTDLPQRPSKAWGWNARRLRWWGESNGYTIPGEAKTPRQIKESMDAQRRESIAYGKEVLRQINKGPGER